MQGPRILALFPYPPGPLRPRSACFIKDLLSFANLDVIYLDNGEYPAIPEGVSELIVVPNRFVNRLMRLGIGALRRRPFIYQYHHSKALVRLLRRLNLKDYDAVYVERLPLQELGISHHNIILDVPDCSARLVHQFQRHSSGPRKLLSYLDSFVLADYEREMCNAARKVICTAEREARAFREIGVRVPITPIPHAPNIERLQPKQVLDTKVRILSFHGKLSYIANRIALKQIRDCILPLLDRRTYVVKIAGAHSQALARHFRDFEFAGYVSDIVAYLRSADISIFPIEISAGLSNKALESLGAGVPVIVTPEIAGGLPRSEGLLEKGIFVRAIRDFVPTLNWYFSISTSMRQDMSDRCVAYVKTLINQDSRRLALHSCIFSNNHANVDNGLSTEIVPTIGSMN